MSAKLTSPRAALRVVPSKSDEGFAEHVSDGEIVEAIERGDDQRADLIVDRLSRIIDATICRMVGRREPEHDDLMQDAFEQIVKTISRHRFAGECSLTSWAVAITSNLCLNALRSRRMERRFMDRTAGLRHDEDSAPASEDVERQVGSRRDLERLIGYLADMDESKAMAVLLYDGMGHDLGEVATLTRCSVPAAQSRLFRGRREIVERMMREEDSDK
ncbi:MAG: RNA polymerase sigma factor [Deltaproteobacteria bacterium]|nr:RNA polymerase sigma factor [Deltaproteobacteria bacterium]